MNSDLTKQELYEGVKTLLETQEDGTAPHLHLNQHKLFTLFSLAFQYFLFLSSKDPGAYILRIEDSYLADKLARKAKDPSTRKFMHSLMIPRKLKYGKSTFFLEFFGFATWNMTNEIPKGKIRGAIIVKNTSTRPLMETAFEQQDEEEEVNPMAHLPEDYYLTTLLESSARTLVIAFEKDFPELKVVQFPFIKKDRVKTVSGVTLAKNLDWDEIDD